MGFLLLAFNQVRRALCSTQQSLSPSQTPIVFCTVQLHTSSSLAHYVSFGLHVLSCAWHCRSVTTAACSITPVVGNTKPLWLSEVGTDGGGFFCNNTLKEFYRLFLLSLSSSLPHLNSNCLLDLAFLFVPVSVPEPQVEPFHPANPAWHGTLPRILPATDGNILCWFTLPLTHIPCPTLIPMPLTPTTRPARAHLMPCTLSMCRAWRCGTAVGR